MNGVDNVAALNNYIKSLKRGDVIKGGFPSRGQGGSPLVSHWYDRLVQKAQSDALANPMYTSSDPATRDRMMRYLALNRLQGMANDGITEDDLLNYLPEEL